MAPPCTRTARVVVYCCRFDVSIITAHSTDLMLRGLYVYACNKERCNLMQRGVNRVMMQFFKEYIRHEHTKKSKCLLCFVVQVYNRSFCNHLPRARPRSCAGSSNWSLSLFPSPSQSLQCTCIGLLSCTRAFSDRTLQHCATTDRPAPGSFLFESFSFSVRLRLE